MARNTSALFKSMANAQDTGEVLLALVTIDSPYITGGPLRVVQNLEDIASNGNAYTAFPFEVTLPEDVDDGPAKVTLSIDNVDRAMVAAIKGIPTTDAPIVTVDIIVASQPDVVEISMPNMVLRNVSGDAFRIDGELRLDEDDLIPYPEGAFTPVGFPGLFA